MLMDDTRTARTASPPVGLTNSCHKARRWAKDFFCKLFASCAAITSLPTPIGTGAFDRSKQTWQEASATKTKSTYYHLLATKTRSTYYLLLLQEHENYEAA